MLTDLPQSGPKKCCRTFDHTSRDSGRAADLYWPHLCEGLSYFLSDRLFDVHAIEQLFTVLLSLMVYPSVNTGNVISVFSERIHDSSKS